MKKNLFALLGLVIGLGTAMPAAHADQNLPGRISSTATMVNGLDYSLTPGGEVLRQGQIISVGGIVTQIVVTRDESIYGLGTDGAIYIMRAYQPWTKVSVGGYVTRFSITRQGLLYGIGTDDNLYVAQPYGPWNRADGRSTDRGYSLLNGEVYHNGRQVTFGGYVVSFYVLNGLIYGTGTDGNLYVYEGSWQRAD